MGSTHRAARVIRNTVKIASKSRKVDPVTAISKDPTRPLNIAHRGGADLWPENTLAAFAEAIALGADGLEFDVQLSADNVLIIHHDARLKPDATRRGGRFLTKPTPRLDALGFDELAQYDVGTLNPDSAYGQRRAARANLDAVQIPSLAALETLVAETAPPGFRLYCELKTDMGEAPDQALHLADAYLDFLESSELAAQHHVISFDWRCLSRVRAARPDMAHAYTTLNFSQTDPQHDGAASDSAIGAAIRAASAKGAPWFDGFDWRDMVGDTHGARVLNAIAAAQGCGWFAELDDVNDENMAVARELGLKVGAWTVNQPADMRTCAALGVEAIVTDRPDILKELKSSS